ncbi:hypothetical protein POSPLADRAFT_1183979 [Postia placenta MAD-698-R-SB12]|uniref:18S rRNA factor 2 n=1 Tax=Postia placenta MAD-698-R-SB12 TaxID=670580 RepID=A0A1X6MSP5_9APHY|nr:hypothetical protein POSPLADRAFT_1183979 [Postia placenta MAD-698-R-SB12]OSX59280.1 hypothetical protein POSPLADRAFT_1183979 [Postia placenta MAD-698-R-SB12]
MAASHTDSRFAVDARFASSPEAGSSKDVADDIRFQQSEEEEEDQVSQDDASVAGSNDGVDEGMDPEGFAGPSQKVVKPLTPEALAAFKAAQEKTGVVYISRIPPGMRPTKVRHIMSAYGEVGRVYLQQEDPKRAYLRRKYTSTKKAHFTEGWVEFKDKRVARSVAEMLNAQPIGGKKGTRWRDDVWTMKYLPKFKWNMLTEQIAHEAAIHSAQLRVELSQSRHEQREYLKNVELARVLDKRAERKRKAEGSEPLTEKETSAKAPAEPSAADASAATNKPKKRQRQKMENSGVDRQLDNVLHSIF